MGAPSKQELRKQLLAARKSIAVEQRQAEAAALAQHTSRLVDMGVTVCAYVPVGSEPGSLEMLDVMVASGARVLLPLTATVDGVPAPLNWAVYLPGELASARYGLLEPTGAALPSSALADASVILVPALAVDRRGVRLGRGAGYYDRSLGFREPTASMVAVVRDDELVDELPGEAHDVAMTHALTPGSGVIALQ